MTNEEAMKKIIKRMRGYFEATGEVGFPRLDLSEFKGLLNLTEVELGGGMYNVRMKIGGTMYNAKTKIGINSVINDDEIVGE